jgi:hypothetical protein
LRGSGFGDILAFGFFPSWRLPVWVEPLPGKACAVLHLQNSPKCGDKNPGKDPGKKHPAKTTIPRAKTPAAKTI